MGYKEIKHGPELADTKRVNHLYELEEFRLHAYKNAKINKEKTERWHEKHIMARTFNQEDKVLLFNS